MEIEMRGHLEVIKTRMIGFFIDSRDQTIDQISVFMPFKEKVLGKVGLGDPLTEVINAFGKWTIDCKVHEPLAYPGVSFETAYGSKAKNASVSCISISAPYKCQAKLPRYISDNLSNKKRKLPQVLFRFVL